MYNVLIILLVVLAATGCGRSTVGPALEGSYEISNYPEIEPNTGLQCLPISLENMLRYYGKNIDLPASQYTGLELYLYTAFLYISGFDLVEIKPERETIKGYIFNGIPVLFVFYKGGNSAHVSVAFKYDQNGFGVKDSDNIGDAWGDSLPTRAFILDRR